MHIEIFATSLLARICLFVCTANIVRSMIVDKTYLWVRHLSPVFHIIHAYVCIWGLWCQKRLFRVGKGNVIVSHIILWTRLFICEQDACFWGRGPHVRCAWLHNISSISVARQIGNSVLFLIVFYWTLCAVLEILLYMSHFKRFYCICHILFLQLDFIYVNVSYFIVAIVLVRNDEIKLFNQSIFCTCVK